MTPLQQLAERGQSVWIDYLSRTFVKEGDLRGLVKRGRRRRDVQPDDLPGRDRRGRRLRRPDPRAERRATTIPRRSSGSSPRTTSATPATSCAPSRTRARARTAGSRSRSTRTSRTTPRPPSPRPSACTRSSTARTCSSRSRRRSRACRRSRTRSRTGIPVNVTLIFSLERHRKVAEAYVRGVERFVKSGGDPQHGRVRRLVLRLARGHRGRQAPGRDRRPRRAQGQARDRQREARLPDLPRGLHDAGVGGAGGQGRDQAALPVGVDVDQEQGLQGHGLRRGADRPRHRQHDAARARRGGRSTTARSAATRCSRTPRRRAGSSMPSSPPASRTTRSCRRSSARASRSSRSRSRT